jgi:hypothetical protein
LFEILTKDLEVVLKSRAAFVLMEFMMHDKTKKVSEKYLKASKPIITATQSELKKKGV